MSARSRLAARAPLAPWPAAAGALAATLARALREAGVAAPVGAAIAFAEALGVVGPDRPSGIYWAGRATLIRRPEDIATYDRVFAAVLAGGVATAARRASAEVVTLALDDGPEPPAGAGPEEAPAPAPGPVLSVRWSDREVLSTRDFAACSAAELDEAHRMMADLRLAGATRRSRRLAPTRRQRGSLDLRRTARAALATGGEPLRAHRRAPGARARRVVLLCDVSGSMAPYSRALVRFAHAVVVGRRRVEVFTIGTRLTRLTRELSSRDPDAALARAAGAVEDWSGGTRLGASLRRFNDAWGQRGLARGADVVICSDGWDRGDPDLLGEQVARLARLAHRVIWVNPLKATPGYQPLARGMAAALPHLDRFLEGHSLGSLEALAAVLAEDGRATRR